MKRSLNMGNLAVYSSVVLYAIYIFLVNWTASASKTANAFWAGDIFMYASNIVLVLCCAMIVCKFLKDIRYYLSRRVYTVFSISILAFLAVTINSISIVLPLIIGFVAINANNRAIVKAIALSFSGLLIFSSLLWMLGLDGGNAISKPLFGDDSYYSVVVPALGMSNPNGVMLIFTGIILSVLYLCSSKRQSRNVSFVLFVLTIILSSITGSTTGFMIGFASIVAMWFVKYGKHAPDFIRKVAPWMFGIVTAITFVTAVNFGPASSLPNPINDALTTRPYMWNLRIDNGTYLNVYGDNDKFYSESSKAGNETAYALDNMTLYILVKYGIVVYLIFFYLFYRGSRRINDPALLVFVLITCSLMFVERMYLFSVTMIFLQKAINEWNLRRSLSEAIK